MFPIYKHYTLPELNRQYNNRAQTPDFAVYLDRYEAKSREAETLFSWEKDIAYGAHPREKLDICATNKENSPVVVFIHGGYWRSFDKSSFRFIATQFVPNGYTLVCINYPLAPNAAMEDIVKSSAKAIQWVNQQYPNKTYLLGHSAGAHLAATAMKLNPELKINAFAGLSGIYNLRPIQKSDLNESLCMSEETALKFSPTVLPPTNTVSAVLAVGSNETDEFKAQTLDFAKQAPNFEAIELPQQNHFSIVSDKSPIFELLLTRWSA